MTSHRHRMSLLAATAPLALFAVGACSHEQRPSTMTAEEHRAVAAQQEAAAQRETTRAVTTAPPPNPVVNPNGIPDGYTYPVDSYNPTTAHLQHARTLEAHAREHVAAAQRLESFEESECRQFPPQTRAACPMLGPVAQISDIRDGVRVRFADNARVDAVVAHMRCHLAYAKVVGFDTSASCPLYVPGLEIERVKDNPQAVDLVSHDRRTVDLIRSRSREEAMLVRGE